MKKPVFLIDCQCMKICFIGKDLAIEKGADSYGGYRRMAYEIINGVKRELNCEVLILADKVFGFPADIKTISDIRLNLWSIIKVRRLIRDVDIINTMDAWPTAVIAWLANLGLKKKLVISAVGTASIKPLYEFPKSFLLKKAYESVDKITAISQFVKDLLLKKLPDLKVEVINLGVDSTKFNSNHVCNHVILEKIDKIKPYILSVGDVRERKGHIYSLEAFNQVAQKLPDLHYAIIGFKQRNDYVDSIHKFIADSRLGGKIQFFEDIRDDFLEELYHHAELFILLPVNIGFDFEGFGLVFLEAAINSLSAITTKENGTEDAIISGETALAVKQRNSNEAAAALYLLLSDKALRDNMGRKAKEFAQKMTWQKTVNEYVSLYQTLL